MADQFEFGKNSLEMATESPSTAAQDGSNGDGTAEGSKDYIPSAQTLVDQQWSRELSKRPLLNREEEIELAQRAQRGEAEAREQFIESNLKLVVSIAKRYRNSGVPMEDLIQEGNMGLVKAVDKFDPDRGCRFSTHAVLWIEGQIRRSIASLRHNIHLPLRIVADLNKLSRVSDELTQKLGQKPSHEELADRMKAPVSHVKQLQELRPDPVSLEEPLDQDLELFLGDVLEDESSVFPDDFAIRRQAQHELHEVLQELPERYQLVLRLRYGLEGGREHTLEEIGQKLKLTRQRVRQIEMSALKKMRCMDCPRLRPFATDDVLV